MSHVMAVRADEVCKGDTTAIRGLVGTVTEVLKFTGNLPRVEITIVTDVSRETAHDVFARDRRVLIERDNHTPVTTDGWVCDVCGRDVNSYGRDGDSIHHV